MHPRGDRRRRVVTAGSTRLVFLPDSLSEDQLDHFCNVAVRGFQQVSSYLSVVPPGRIDIRIVDVLRRSAAYHHSHTIVISRHKLPDKTAVIHELTHLIAGTSGDSNGTLDEGLAVYLQATFGDRYDRSFPTEGADLHAAAAAAIAEHNVALPLTTTPNARLTARSASERRLAYLEEGSFVRFLIEERGLACFLQVYRAQASWKDVFGTERGDLEQAWLQRLSAGFAVNTQMSDEMHTCACA
jgi:hypothetical protein